jgi:hypothetical protein
MMRFYLDIAATSHSRQECEDKLAATRGAIRCASFHGGGVF